MKLIEDIEILLPLEDQKALEKLKQELHLSSLNLMGDKFENSGEYLEARPISWRCNQDGYIISLTIVDFPEFNYNIFKFPDAIREFEKLEKLQLGIHLNYFPESLRSLPNIRILIFNSCLFRFIPIWIEEMKWIIELGLINTPLDFIPPEIGNLENLEKLFLWNINVTELPDTMRNLVKLKYLSLNIAGIKILPSFLAKLPNLETLGLQNWENVEPWRTFIQRNLPDPSIDHIELSVSHEISYLLTFESHLLKKIENNQNLDERDEIYLPIHPQRWFLYQLAEKSQNQKARKICKNIESSSRLLISKKPDYSIIH